MIQYFRVPHFCGGVNITDNPHYLNDNTCLRTKNLLPFGVTNLIPRSGFFSVFGYGGFPFTGKTKVKSIKYMPELSMAFIVVTSGSMDYFYVSTVSSSGSFSTPTLLDDFTAGNFYTYAKVGSNYYIARGTHNYLLRFDGTTLTELNPTSGSALHHYKPKYVIEFRDRLFLANYYYDTTPHYNAVAYSDVLTPETIGAGSVLYVGSKPITAMNIFTFTTATETVESQLFVSNIDELYVVPFTDSPQSIQQLSGSNGCKYPESVCHTPYGLVFANDNGIYLIKGNGETELISEQINKYLTYENYDVLYTVLQDGLVRSLNHGITCYYWNGFLIVSYIDMETTIDTQTTSWWLDMERTKGWFGEIDMDTICYETINGNLYAGMVNSGDIVKYTPYISIWGDTYYNRSGDLERRDVSIELITKYFSMDNEYQDKIFRKIGIQVFNGYPTELKLGTVIDGTAKEVVITVSVASNVPSSLWDSAIWDSSTFFTTVGGYAPNYAYFTNRGRGKTIALRITEHRTYGYKILLGGLVIAYIPTGRML